MAAASWLQLHHDGRKRGWSWQWAPEWVCGSAAMAGPTASIVPHQSMPAPTGAHPVMTYLGSRRAAHAGRPPERRTQCGACRPAGRAGASRQQAGLGTCPAAPPPGRQAAVCTTKLRLQPWQPTPRCSKHHISDYTALHQAARCSQHHAAASRPLQPIGPPCRPSTPGLGAGSRMEWCRGSQPTRCQPAPPAGRQRRPQRRQRRLAASSRAQQHSCGVEGARTGRK